MRWINGWIDRTIGLLFLLLFPAVACGNDSVAVVDKVPLPELSYSIGHKQDSIRFASALEPFFSGLDSLRNGTGTVLTVVHLGDSHLQAGYYSGKMMRLLQAQFGNAGRGWVAPFKLGRLNEPDDYFITSTLRE